MKFKNLIIPLSLMCAGTSAFGAAPLQEPSSSLMASGHWAKIRVNDDAVYELTYDQLVTLGFDNPERVNVYGYNPVLLLTHDFSRMPVDLEPVYTMHLPEQRKIVFFVKGDTEYAPELWQFETNAKKYNHSKHSHSTGATYLLGDVGVTANAPVVEEAPESIDGNNIFTSHTALVYHEDDIRNYAEGGFWLAGPAINSSRKSESHKFTVNNVATGKATMVYKCIMSNKRRSGYDYLQTSYSDGITASESTGAVPDACQPYQNYTQAIRFQELNLPVKTEPTEYEVTFSVHPMASEMIDNCALDYYGLRYERSNDLTGIGQVRMYFENFGTEALFELSGISKLDNWHVWNITSSGSVKRMNLSESGGKHYGALQSAATNHPNAVIAFDVTATQPSPEIIGALDNQNLHSMATPDLVIITSKILMPSAERIAAIHRKYQNIEVAVVDQQHVFNEFSSGNTSPEALRRFLRHLDMSTPDKLKGLLLLGPSTYNTPSHINDNEPYVLTAQTEDYAFCPMVTRNYCSDTFFGHFGERNTSGLWISRVSQLQVFGYPIDIAVGRVPLETAYDINRYYDKVEEYLLNPPSWPSIGNYILASDYAGANEEPHLNNAEALVDSISRNGDRSVTITRVASNLVSDKDNVLTRKMLDRAMDYGANLFVYFGHGSASNIGGSTSLTHFLCDMQTAERMTTPGRYPFMFLGSCNVATFDRHFTSLTHKFLSNAKGGAVGVISSSREVFQPMNQYLGQVFAGELTRAADGEWIGAVWARAQSNAVCTRNASKENIANHLDYNLLGDPALPIYAATHFLSVDAINDNTVYNNTNNRITGSVVDANGDVATEFNGMVTLTFYNPQVDTRNVFQPTTGQMNYYHYESVTLDQDMIGQFTGSVENGRFSIDLVGPHTAMKGTHRIQFYAWSADGRLRALGSVSDISIVEADGAEPPVAEPAAIRSFEVADNNISADRVTINAEIFAPSGLAAVGSMLNPVRFELDGVTYTNAHRMLKVKTPDVYSLEYVTAQLATGKHTASIAVMDAGGNWIERSLEFMVNNFPEAELSAAVNGEVVDFELASAIADASEKRLIIERLNGDMVLDRLIDGTSAQLTLAPGAYRAYVQLKAPSAAASTSKIELIID